MRLYDSDSVGGCNVGEGSGAGGRGRRLEHVRTRTCSRARSCAHSSCRSVSSRFRRSTTPRCSAASADAIATSSRSRSASALGTVCARAAPPGQRDSTNRLRRGIQWGRGGGAAHMSCDVLLEPLQRGPPAGLGDLGLHGVQSGAEAVQAGPYRHALLRRSRA